MQAKHYQFWGSRWFPKATTLTQFKTKKDAISKLNDDICEAIQDEAELETELTDADTYLTELEEKKAILEDVITKASQPP